MPESWLKNAIRNASRIGRRRRSVQKRPAETFAEEAAMMYDLIEHGVVPAYYERNSSGVPTRYVQMGKESMRTVAPQFSARRMLLDYIYRLYGPAATGH